MADDRPSRLPGGLNTQLVTAIIVALGIGGGSGSLLAHQQAAPPDMDRAKEIFATKLQVAEMQGELALIRQEVAQVSDQLTQVAAQIVAMDRRKSAD